MSYECVLLIEAVNDMNDKIRGLNSLNVPSRTEDEKIMKIKSSLLTNVLTLKVLASAFVSKDDSANEKIDV